MLHESGDYSRRVTDQIEQYKCGNENELPDAFHYWSQNYISPKLKEIFGNDSIHRIFKDLLLMGRESLESGHHYHFASLGAGDCSAVEIKLAEALREEGIDAFTIDCYELSDGLRERAKFFVDAAGFSSHFNLIGGDINQDPLRRVYDGIMAHHSLHHFVNLEIIFDEVKNKLKDGGTFAVFDIIGRNGHMRWPEIEGIVHKIWKILPSSKKYNTSLKETWEDFANFDCSAVGFEGIRSQDILPALLSRFYFSHCVAFGGLVEVFVDRAFGHNYDPNDPFDRAFIDMLEHLENCLIDNGAIKPTMMFAGLVKKAVPCKYHSVRSPVFCLRPPTPC